MPFPPVPPDFGSGLRAFHLLRQLARDHEVTVLGYGNDGQAAMLERAVPVRSVRFVRAPFVARHRRLGQLAAALGPRSFYHLSVVGRELQREIDRHLARERFDVVHTVCSNLGPFRLSTPAVRILDAHNVEHDVFRRHARTLRWGLRKLHYWLESRKHRREELALCRAQDALLVTSERDARIFRRDIPDVPIHVVPNGVETRYFTPSGRAPEPWSLVFTGMMAYLPNAEGVEWFLSRVMPLVLRGLPEARIYVVGRGPTRALLRLASERVVVTGPVPDVRPYVDRASVYVVPLHSGGGTRLKIAEALAMRKPIVTTRIGAEGVDLVDGETALFADEPEDFARAVGSLLRDAPLRARLAEAGYSLVKRRYEWEVIGESLAAIYRDIGRRPPQWRR